MYTFLGFLAKLQQWGHQRHGTLIPLPVMALALSTWVFLLGLSSYLEWANNRGQPENLSVSKLVQSQSLNKTYVRLSGVLLKDAPLRISGSKDVYYPLRDLQDEQAILVRLPRPDFPLPQQDEVAIEGTLHFLNPDLAQAAPPDDHQLRLNRDQFLLVGERPPSLYQGLLLLALGSATTIPFGWVVLTRGTIFRSQTIQPPPPQKLAAHLPVRITARFPQLDGKGQLEVFQVEGQIRPAKCGSGTLQLDHQAEATWQLKIEPEKATKIKAGLLYLGREQRPALSWTGPGPRGRNRRVVLSCDCEEDRQAIWAALLFR